MTGGTTKFVFVEHDDGMVMTLFAAIIGIIRINM